MSDKCWGVNLLNWGGGYGDQYSFPVPPQGTKLHIVALKCNYSYRNCCHFSAAHEQEQHEDVPKYIFSSSRFKHPHSNFCVCCKLLWLKQVYCYVMQVQSLCPRCFKITKPYTYTGGIWNFSSSPAAGLSFSTNNMKNLTLPALRWYINLMSLTITS